VKDEVMAVPHTSKHPEKSAAVRSLRKEQGKQAARTPADKEAELERGLKDSFPASDPVSATNTTTSGEPDKGSTSK
jgi:hypothetical protein